MLRHKEHALLLAAKEGRLEVAKYLVSKGANSGNMNTLFWAAREGHSDIVQYLESRSKYAK